MSSFDFKALHLFQFEATLRINAKGAPSFSYKYTKCKITFEWKWNIPKFFGFESRPD